jgi:hypothetical protein
MNESGVNQNNTSPPTNFVRQVAGLLTALVGTTAWFFYLPGDCSSADGALAGLARILLIALAAVAWLLAEVSARKTHASVWQKKNRLWTVVIFLLLSFAATVLSRSELSVPYNRNLRVWIGIAPTPRTIEARNNGLTDEQILEKAACAIDELFYPWSVAAAQVIVVMLACAFVAAAVYIVVLLAYELEANKDCRDCGSPS